jgi:arylsulfatase B
MLTESRLLAVIGSALLGASCSQAGEPVPQDGKPHRKPNIIVILADDLGYADLGCQGCKDVPTPNIDSLARHGIRCTDGYVSSPFCSPSRAGILTGRYQQRFGHEFNLNPTRPRKGVAEPGLPLSEVTLADRLKAQGYATGIVGKWHLGAGRFHPLRRGFDEFFGFLQEGHFYVPARHGNVTSALRVHEPAYDTLNPVMRGFEPVDEEEYLTEAFTREATRFIGRHKDQPFFLYLAYNAVHSPMQAVPKYLERFGSIADKKRRVFAGMLAALDEGVGAILQKLLDARIAGDTLIFFLSDNGGPTAELTTSNLPLRGYKGEVLEGGIRVPFFVQWQGHLPAGVEYHLPIIALDILPTAVAAAKGTLPGGARIDGVNLLPHFTVENVKAPHEFLFWRLGSQMAVRKGNWKLVKNGNGEVQLFDLAADIGEKRNLAAQRPGRARELDVALQQWNRGLAKPLWPAP